MAATATIHQVFIWAKSVEVIAPNKKKSAPDVLKQLDKLSHFLWILSSNIKCCLSFASEALWREAHLNAKVQQRAYDSVRDMCQMRSAPINKKAGEGNKCKSEVRRGGLAQC